MGRIDPGQHEDGGSPEAPAASPGRLAAELRVDTATGGDDPLPSPLDALRTLEASLATDASLGDAGPPPSLDPVPSLGRYALREVIGRGGMGIVYRATDPTLGRDVAIKFIGLVALSDRGRQRFQREARAVARLDHPHIVRLYDAGQWQGLDYFVMRLVRGPTLAQRIAEGPIEVSEATALAAQLGRALAYAHERGLIHRDVKPSNVLIDEDGSAVLTDFGVARDLSDASPQLTHDSRLIGTPAYMAPEQLLQGEEVGPAADQYALALVLWEMVTGKRPAGLADLDRRRDEGEGAIPEGLRRLCRRALSPHAQDRYASVAAMVEDLERSARGAKVLAPAPPRRRVAMRWIRARRDALAVAGVGAALLIAALGGLGLWLNARESARKEEAAQERLAATLKRVQSLDASGHPQEGDGALDAFTQLSENTGTRAVAQAWLTRAARARDGGDTKAESDSLARAYVASTDDQERAASLRGLAHHLRAQWEWDSLAELLDTVPERIPSLAGDADLSGLRGETAFARHDFGAAAAAFAAAPGMGAPARLAARFAHATRTAHLVPDGSATVAHPPSGPPELWLTSTEATELRRLSLSSPQLPLLSQLAIPGTPARGHNLFALDRGPDQPADALLWRSPREAGGYATLLRFEGDGIEPIFEWPTDQIGDAIAADVDGDGEREIYVGALAYQRDLRALRPDGGGGYDVEFPHGPTNLAASDITALRALDMDGDGLPELALGDAAWSAYDVRLLEPGDDGALKLKARLKLGTVVDLAILPGSPARLAALKVDIFPNPDLFSPEQPFGAPAGIYLLSLDGDDLKIDQFIPLSAKWSPRALKVGDLDGDGRVDLILSTERLDDQRTLIYLQEEGGGFTELSLLGALALAVADVDDDPADELAVSVVGDGRRLWVLGAGDETLPPVRRARPERAPPLDDPAVASTWLQAGDLAAIGLVDSAVRLYRELTTRTLNPESVAAALLRGGQLLRESGHRLASAKMFEDATQPLSRRRAEALSTAAAAWRSINEVGPALRVIDRLLTDGAYEPGERDRWIAERAQLASRLDEGWSWSLDLSHPLDAGWRVERPEALRWQQVGHTLSISQIERPDAAPLAWMPVEWDGRPLTLEVELALERLEWGSGIGIGLRSADGSYLTVSARGWGGSAQLHQDLGCRVEGGSNGVQLAVSSVEERRRIGMRLDVLESGDLRCIISDLGTGEILSERSWSSELGAPGRWRLVIEGEAPPYVGPTWARATLLALKVQGIRRLAAEDQGDEGDEGDEGDDAAWYEASRLLTNGDPQGALRLVDAGAPGGDATAVSMLRYRALLDLGRPQDAITALEEALSQGLATDPLWRPTLRALTRERPDQLGPLFQARLGQTTWVRLLAESWNVPAQMHPGDPTVRSTLNLTLGPAPSPASVGPEIAEVIELLMARGRARILAREWGAARGDVLTAIALIERQRAAAPDDPESLDIHQHRLSECHSMLAELASATGDREQALAEVREALASSPVPELMADRLTAAPGLASLRADPRWQEWVGPEPAWMTIQTATRRSAR